MDNLKRLKEWLDQPCDEIETAINPLGGGAYIPIENVNRKIKYAETMFGARFKMKNFSHSIYQLINNPAVPYIEGVYQPPYSAYASGSIEVEISCLSDENYDEDSFEYEVDSLVGAATFNTLDYHPNTHWGATCKSLCISNALLKYPQFGGWLNNQRVDFAPVNEAAMKGKKKAGIIEEQKLKNAFTAGDEKTIEELHKLYDFNVTTD